MLFSYFSPIFAIANFNKQLVRNTAAKIQILDKQINSFGGIFYVISQFCSSGQAALIDKTLGVKGINTKFAYSDVVENLMSVFVSGGEVLEDVNFFRKEAFKANPDYRKLPSLGKAHRRQQGFRSGGDLLRFFSSPHSFGWGNLCPLVCKMRFRRPRNRIFRQPRVHLHGFEAPAGG